jgi:SAM-dependent methyltransferase
MLHIAPEPALSEKFMQHYHYVSIDLTDRQAMIKMDVRNLKFPDEYFDAVVCNHVLEHVPDDRKALHELYRVLKVGGWGSIQVPMKGPITQEDLAISGLQERSLRFGQEDHVRQYGTDFKNRLVLAGFKPLTLLKKDLLDPKSLERMSVEIEKEVLLVIK